MEVNENVLSNFDYWDILHIVYGELLHYFIGKNCTYIIETNINLIHNFVLKN
jgi:hypothetical protein